MSLLDRPLSPMFSVTKTLPSSLRRIRVGLRLGQNFIPRKMEGHVLVSENTGDSGRSKIDMDAFMRTEFYGTTPQLTLHWLNWIHDFQLTVLQFWRRLPHSFPALTDFEQQCSVTSCSAVGLRGKYWWPNGRITGFTADTNDDPEKSRTINCEKH